MDRAEEARPEARKALHLTGRLFKFALPHWPLILLTITAVAIATASEGGYLLMIKPFMQKALRLPGGESAMPSTGAAAPTAPMGEEVQKAISSGIHLAKWMMLLAPIMAFGMLLHEYLRSRVVWAVIVDIRNNLCRALLPQSLRYFETRRTGDFISRVTNDVAATEKALEFVFGDVLMDLGRLAVALAVAVYRSWELGLLCLIVLGLVSLPVSSLARRVRKAGKKGLERLSDMTDAMSQMFSGIRIVKIFQMEEAEAEEFQRHNRRFFGQMMRMARAKALSKATVVFMTRFFLAVLVLVGCLVVGYAVWDLNWGDLTTLIGCGVVMYGAVRDLAKSYNDLQQALGGAERIFEVLDHTPEIQDEPDAITVDDMHHAITFRDVSFAYDTDPVLRHVKLEVRKGQTIAIVGRSGAGKSSLVNLIPRFYDPTEGSVELDGVDIRKIRRDSLLSLIAVVTQQTFLFNRSIADNIRYGRRGEASLGEIHAAAQAANIHDFVLTLPQGYDTEVGEMGVRLSGGQRQRIAIARAILKNAPILILDEAMVGLDAESETAVRDAIIQLMKGRTTFLIAHDLTEIQHADYIVVLKEGRIVEIGTHDKLVALGGEYQHLLELQMGGAKLNDMNSGAARDY